MKKYFFLLFIIFIFCCAKGQNVLKVEYEKVDTKTPHLPDNLPEETRKMILEQVKSVKKHILYYSNGNTFYTDFTKAKEVEISKDVEQVGEHKKVIKRQTFAIKPFLIYHKKGEKGFYTYRKYFDEEYYEYTEPQWKSVDYREDIQKIDNFECKLVDITDQDGRVHHVWYTEQVPISAGPYRFNDLPGLVLKIEAPTYTLYATKVSNDAKPSDVETLNPKLKIYKGEELTKKKAEMNKPKVTRKVIRL